MNTSTLQGLADEFGQTVESLARQLEEQPSDATAVATLEGVASRLSSLRQEQRATASVVAVAESLVVEAAALLLATTAGDPDDQRDRALTCLDEAVREVDSTWPALRLSVLLRALALAAPLLRGDGEAATAAEQRMERWAALVSDARGEQLQLEARAASQLALADHLAQRLEQLSDAQRPPIRERALEYALDAGRAAAFAGDSGLGERAATLAATLR